MCSTLVEAAVWFFYLHTVLCGAYLCLLARVVWVDLFSKRSRIALAPLTRSAVTAAEEGSVVYLAGYALLGLYLAYGEIYLYNIFQMMQP